MRVLKILAITAVFILTIFAFYYVVVNSNPVSEPPNLRITKIGDKMFVRWTSNYSTFGSVEINGVYYNETSSRMLHKIVVPYFSKGHMRIKEYVNGKEYASYCVDLSKVRDLPIYAGIYAGYGADTGSYRMLSNMLAHMGIKTEFLIAENFSKTYDLFKYDLIVFPGGRADHMISGLSRHNIDVIREYVKEGGAYMGVCAGAYFASNYTVWKGVEYGDYAGYVLDLYSGKAVGPIKEIGDYDTGSIYNPQYPTNITWYSGKKFNVTYWGGPYFTPVDKVTVIATYDKVHKPAAIKFSYNGGRVILFGFHPEFDTHYSEENRKSFLNALKPEIMWLAGA